MTKLTSETSQSGMQIYLKHPRNLIRTVFLVISWTILSLHFELIGPTMGILAHNTHVTYNGIASALAARSGGYFVANVLCCIFQNIVKNYPDLMLAVSFFLSAIVVFATPFISSIILMCILFFGQGVAMSFTNLSGSSILFNSWGVNAAAPLSIVHFGYGLGAIFANLLVRPFLGSDNPSLNNITTSPYIYSSFPSSIAVPSNSNIQIPYSIAAGLCFLVGVEYLIFFLCAKKNHRDKLEIDEVDYTAVNMNNPSNNESHGDQIKFSQYSPVTCGRGFFTYGLSLSLIFTTYIFFVGGTDQTFSKFYFSYLRFERFGISTKDASWGIILYWLSYSIGRLISAIVCVFVPVYIFLTVTWFVCLLLAIAWMIYVWILGLTATSLFVLGSLTGLVISPLYPLSFGMFNQKLNVVPPLLALLLCGSALGSLTLQKIVGLVMDFDPNHFPTFFTGCIILPIILYIISNIVTFFHKQKLKTEQNPIKNDVPLTSDKLGEEEQQLTDCL